MKSSKKLICSAFLTIGIITSTFTPNFASESKSHVPNVSTINLRQDYDGFKSGKLTEKSKEAPEKIVEKYYSKGSAKKSKKEFKKDKQFKNSMGRTVIKTTQTYKGIPVYGTEQNYHVNDDGVIECIVGSNIDNIEEKLASSAVPAGHSLDSILAVAEKDLGFKPAYQDTPKAEMVLFPVNGQYIYVYKVNIKYSKPRYNHCTYYIDANNLSVVKVISNMSGIEESVVGSGIGQFNNVKQDLKMVRDTNTNTYSLKNMVDNIITVNSSTNLPFSEPDSFFNSGTDTNLQKEAVDAHYYLQKVVNFFKGYPFNRNGNDGLGSQMTITMNNDFNEFNAWGDINTIIVEAGKGVAGRSLSCGLDTIAHEFTHGMLYSEGLGNEAAPLHEGLADVFAAICEYNIGNDGTFDWSVGEDTGEIFRNCAYPVMDDYDDVIMYSNPGTAPHTQGGVITKAAYLIAEGGTHNDYTVTGLGYQKLAQIFYFAIHDGYLTSNMSFYQFAGTLLVCTEFLYNLNSPEYTSVKNALYAVGLGLRSTYFYAPQCTLQWPGTTGFNYGIYRKPTDSTAEPVMIAQVSETTATVDALPGSCNFYVADVDSMGNRMSPFSNPVTVEDYQYTSPENFAMTYRGGLSVSFAWTGQAGVSYGIFRKPTGSKLPPVKIAETTNSSITVDTLIGSYSFYVAKVDSQGYRISPLSNVVTVESYLYSPSNFTLTSTDWSQVNLSWLGEAGARYGVYRRHAGTTETPVKVGETTNSYISVNSELGYYDFLVAKIDAAGYRTSYFTSPVTLEIYMSAPTNVYADRQGNDTVLLYWEGVTRGLYAIYARPSGTTDVPVKVAESSSTGLNLLLQTGSYDYFVAKVDRQRYMISDFSDPITLVRI